MMKKMGLLTGCGLLAMAWGGAAFAQASDGASQDKVQTSTGAAPQQAAPSADRGQATATAAQAASAGFGAPGDIVVTANKRVQRLNDVGVTAAVLGGTQLAQQNVHSLTDIATRVPSLSYAAAPNGTPVYTLRGVGFYETSIGAYPSVSIYTDEIPLPFPVMTAHSTYDLERVEVLKGPQGTLFGENATGGAINYIVAKPTSTSEAGITGTYGRFNEADVEGYVSGPVTSTMNARLSGRIETADGWQVSSSRPGDHNGKVRNYMGRFQLAFKPTSSLRFLLDINGWKDQSETQAPQYIAQQFQNENIGVPYGLPVGAFRDPAVLASPFSPNNDRAADWSTSSHLLGAGKIPHADNSLFQVSLRADLDVGDFGTITSLSAYTKFDEDQGNDTDGLPLNALDVPLTIGHIKTEFQELRFANKPTNPFRFVVGGNYEHDKVYQDLDIDYYNSSARIGFGQLFGFPLSADNLANDQRMRNYAFFGNVEYDLVPKVTLIGGVRYTNTRDRAAICQSDPDGPAYPFGNVIKYFGSVYSGQPFEPYTPGECVSINVDTTAPTQPAVGYLPYGATGEYFSTLQQHNISWKAGINYKPNRDTLLYATVTKGYKAGSFPSITGSTLNQYEPARQESVMAYEGGIKASLLDRRLQINAAGFYYDYRDKQLRTKLNDPVFGQLDVLANIPKSSVKGGEVEITGRISRDLTLTGAYTYLDAKVDKFIGVNAGGDTGINFAGTPIPYTPKNQLALSADYQRALNDRLKLFFGATVNYRSSTIATLDGKHNPSTVSAASTSCVYCIKGYALVDGQIGIESSGGGWRAFIWGKNIFNKYYWTNVVSGYDTVARYAGRPATYGVTVALKFH